MFISCKRTVVESAAPVYVTGARPTAILQPGNNPLWFQLTEEGPLLLETIEDAINSAALIPWPLAMHVRFFLERQDEIIIAVNRDGFMKFAPNGGDTDNIAMYRFSGGDYWRRYSVGGFVFYADKPACLLYMDDRFLDAAFPPPLSRTWTFNMESNMPFPLQIPALEYYPAEEGWDVDALRPGPGGFIYYRAVRRNGAQPEIYMLRTSNLDIAGDIISIDVFYSSVPNEENTSYPALPPLPKGYIYTGKRQIGNNIIAFWEEQDEFYTGAAGFMVVKNK
jgi:hypothetical protein